MKKYSNQFPTRLKISPPKPRTGSLIYTYPATGISKPVVDYIDLPWPQLAKGIDVLVQHGYIRERFEKKYANK